MARYAHKRDWSRLCGILLFAGSIAQAAPSLTLPTDFLLPNYDRIPLGQTEALEGGAFVARSEEALATWYNPAGVSRNKTSLINASSAVFEWTQVNIEGLGTNRTATNQNSLPAFIGGVIGTPPLHTKKLRLGFSVVKPTVWSIALEDGLSTSVNGGTERLNYTSSGSFSETIVTSTLSYAPGNGFYYGISVGLDLTSLTQNLVVSDQLTTTSTSQNSIKTLRTSGSAKSFIAILGTQWDATDHLRIGAVVKLPAISLGGQSDLFFESLDSAPGQTNNIYIHDGAAFFKYQKPIEGVLGAAYFFDGAALEFDAKFHGGTDQYQLYGTNQQATIVSAAGSGASNSTSLAFPNVNYSARSVVNAAIGGYVRLNSLLDAHAGFFTIFSPVKDQTGTPFKNVALYGSTFGVSVRSDHLSGSIGGGYEFGASDEFNSVELLGGQTIPSKMNVTSFSVLSALSYKF